MASKNKANNAEVVETEEIEKETNKDAVSPLSNKQSKPQNKNTKTKTKEKRPNIFSRLHRRAKETGSELKKVTWPTFRKVCKETGIVIGIVAIFALLLLGIDKLLELLFGLLIK